MNNQGKFRAYAKIVVMVVLILAAGIAGYAGGRKRGATVASACEDAIEACGQSAAACKERDERIPDEQGNEREFDVPRPRTHDRRFDARTFFVPITVAASNETSSDFIRRNIIWRVLNHQDRRVRASPEKRIGLMLRDLLHPQSTRDAKYAAFSQYIAKGTLYLRHDQRETLYANLGHNDPHHPRVALLAYAKAEARAALLVRDVLNDERRINLFLAGGIIDLERNPDKER